MNISFRQLLTLQVVLVAAVIPIQSGCGNKQAMTQESHITWDSPKMFEIKREWDSLRDIYTKSMEKLSEAKESRDTHRELVRMQGDLLRKRFSDNDVRQLAANCESLPVHWRDWSEFDRAVVHFMFDVLVYLRDRESLVTLLSTRFPLRIGNWPIEESLAREARLNNPILILGEAYAKCRIPEVRHDIAAAVRRAFGGLGITGKDDADFVTNALQWYGKNKQHLAVNTGYCDDMWPIEPEEGGLGRIFYEEIWSHAKLFTTIRNKGQPVSGTSQSDQPKSETLGKPVNEASSHRENSWRAEDELDRLNGTWEVIEVIARTEPIPEAKIKGVRMVFHKETLEWIGSDGKKEDEFRVRLGSQQEPSAIDLVQTPSSAMKKEQATGLVHELQDETTSAIYELKGDTLRICLPRHGAWQRPTSFKTEEGSDTSVITLRRVK
ncbi:MAG: TIGR03067 domain-containing protein [Pirellulaceae bacterium]|nr:TIGR03067 domain-containing protein [Pirellulaceae bacterium]